MNAKPEQIQTGSSAGAAEKNAVKAPDASAAELTAVTNEELDQVEGGNFVGANHFKIINVGNLGHIGGRNG